MSDSVLVTQKLCDLHKARVCDSELRLHLEDVAIKNCSDLRRKAANAISGIACQNAAYLAAICDLELGFEATTGGRVAIWAIV